MEPHQEKFTDTNYAVRSVDNATRSVHAIFSSAAIDSHGERVEQSFNLKRFNENPVVLWAHNRQAGSNGLPIGRAKNIAVRDGKLQGTVTFASKEANPLAEQIWQLYAEGMLKAFSIGFRPGRVDVEKVGGDEIFVLKDNELFEISAVPLPSNGDALVKMKAMDLGHLSPFWKKEMTKQVNKRTVPETSQQIRVRLQREADARRAAGEPKLPRAGSKLRELFEGNGPDGKDAA